jgi:hypothetical protein
MNISNNNHPNIFDLPNEILFIIINKLNIVDVSYSLVDLNERFAQLVLDPLYIQNLNITNMTMNSYYDRTFSVHEKICSRICKNILPKIHNEVKQLATEQHSIERILTFNYSQLYSLSLVNFKEEILFQYLMGIFLILSFFFIFINEMNFYLKIIQFFVIFLHNKLHI